MILMIIIHDSLRFFIFFFFFSSRRRHTRYWRDWSSDVCSSDLSQILNLKMNISRKHAVITWRNSHFEIQDLGSVNGTSVNETPVDNQPRVLKDGDKVSFDTIEATFSEHKQPQTALKKDDVRQTIIMKLGTQPSLVISTGPGEGRRILLREGVMTVGRATSKSENWDIALQDRSVSRPHARVENNHGIVTYTDMASVNG